MKNKNKTGTRYPDGKHFSICHLKERTRKKITNGGERPISVYVHVERHIIK